MLGVMVFAHGSRDPLWREPVEAVARAIAARDPGAVVSCAYLELCAPDMPAAAAELIERGATRIGMGKHAREDLPVLLADLRSRYPGVLFEQLPTAGENPRLTALLAEMALENAP